LTSLPPITNIFARGKRLPVVGATGGDGGKKSAAKAVKVLLITGPGEASVLSGSYPFERIGEAFEDIDKGAVVKALVELGPS
jgi:hypothetical protein